LIATPNDQASSMLGIPRRYAHFMFGMIQSGLTSAIAAAVASVSLLNEGTFVGHWLQSWLVAWTLMLPVVVVAAPLIRKMSLLLTRPDAT
jgi:Mn2+/Fe2+ NRAMP family transporter